MLERHRSKVAKDDMSRMYYDEVLSIRAHCPHCSKAFDLRSRARHFRPIPQPLPQYSGWRLVGWLTACVVVVVIFGVVMLSVVIDNL